MSRIDPPIHESDPDVKAMREQILLSLKTLGTRHTEEIVEDVEAVYNNIRQEIPFDVWDVIDLMIADGSVREIRNYKGWDGWDAIALPKKKSIQDQRSDKTLFPALENQE